MSTAFVSLDAKTISGEVGGYKLRWDLRVLCLARGERSFVSLSRQAGVKKAAMQGCGASLQKQIGRFQIQGTLLLVPNKSVDTKQSPCSPVLGFGAVLARDLAVISFLELVQAPEAENKLAKTSCRHVGAKVTWTRKPA
jgi:hypothetical protein